MITGHRISQKRCELSRTGAKYLDSFALVNITLCLMVSADLNASEKDGNQVSDSTRSGIQESRDRHVDQAALQAQEAAIRKLKPLLKKYRGTAQESFLLMRMARIYQETSAIEFRIAYGKAHKRKSAPDLKRYQAILNSSIENLNNLIRKFPRFDDIDQCLFMRGKAYEEVSKQTEAKADYLRLVKDFPDSDRAVPSYMALAELAIGKNDHAEAIKYLTHVYQVPDSPQYPFALYKLAWSYYNLKDFPNALGFLEKHIRFYDELHSKSEQSGDLATADSAMKDNSLMDAVLFYLDENEQRDGKYSVSDAIKYFRKLTTAPILGKMELRFSKMLRSHRRDDVLMEWKSTLVREERTRPETVESVMTVFEHMWNQQKLDNMVAASRDLVLLYQKNTVELQTSEAFDSARKVLSETAESLHKSLVSSKNAQNGQAIFQTLSQIYDVLIQVVPETDPRVAQVHYNLAEILFEIRKFDQAANHYRWVVEHWNKGIEQPKADIELKAVGARYEHLREKGRIPAQLTAQSLDQKTASDLKDQVPLEVGEWISWVDLLPNYSPKKGSKSSDGLSDQKARENMLFEANRVIYGAGLTRLATDRMIEFVVEKPGSKFAEPSAMLSVDTYIKSENWVECRAVTGKFLEKEELGDAFHKRMGGVRADCTFKIAEGFFNSKDFTKARKWAETLEEEYPGSARAADGLTLVSRIFLENKEEPNGMKILTRLIEKYPGTPGFQAALLRRAEIYERSYDFDHAIIDYQKLLGDEKLAQGKKIAGADSAEIAKKLSFLKWINGGASSTPSCKSGNSEAQSFEADLARQVSKAESASSEDQRWIAMSLLSGLCLDLKEIEEAKTDSTTKTLMELAKEGSAENRSLWALIALTRIDPTELRSRLSMIKLISKGWGDMDPVVRVSVLPVLNRLLPLHLASIRRQVKRLVPINKASPQAISRRVEWIKAVDQGASAALSLPWIRLQVEVLLQLSLTYRDFAETLKSLPLPKEMVGPEHAEELQTYQKELETIILPFSSRAIELAKNSIEMGTQYGAESSLIEKVAAEFPELDQKVQSEFVHDVPEFEAYNQPWKMTPEWIDGVLLSSIQDQNERVTPSTKSNTSDLNGLGQESADLVRFWKEAYSKGNWAKAGFLLQKMSTTKEIPPPMIRIMQGLTLIAVGEQSEGLHELQEAEVLLNRKYRTDLRRGLLSFYIHSKSSKAALKIIHEVQDEEAEAKKKAQEKKKGEEL